MLSRAAAHSSRALLGSTLRRLPAYTPTLASLVWARGITKDRDAKLPGARFAKPPNVQQKGMGAPGQPCQSRPATRPPPSPTLPEAASAGSASSNASPQDHPESAPPFDQSSREKEQDEIDVSKLADLTQGIPSTLEYERAKSRPQTEDATEQWSGDGGRGKGELPASAYVSSSDKRRLRRARWAYAAAAVTIVCGALYLGREWDEAEAGKHPDVSNGWSVGLWWRRAVARMTDVTSQYQEPAYEKLLPDPDPTFARPYTLCISLEEMLVHSEWTRENGWRVAKRPGVDYFLRYLSQYYEIVLFTSVPFGIGEPLVRKLDPYRFIMWPLYREATKYKDGEIVKDLSYLNRDLAKVIIMDTDPKHVRAQPENAIILPKWTGSAKDDGLIALVPFLEFIHTMQYPDVREVLASFQGKHIPTDFARREAIARAAFHKRLEAEGIKKKPTSGASAEKLTSGVGMLAGLLGLKPSNMSLLMPAEGEENPQDALAKGKMLHDLARERGQRTYAVLEQQIRDNGAKWLQEEAEMQEKAQKEIVDTMRMGFLDSFYAFFGLGAAKQGDGADYTNNAPETD